jgi:Putative auto-transporter adhesin, head GIN domain
MKKLLLFLAIAATAASCEGQDKVINDANAVVRQAKNFHAIEVGDGVDLFLTQSNDEAVAVSAAKAEYRDKITTVVEDGVLKIYYGPKYDWRFGWNNSRRLKAYVSVKSIDRLAGSGGSDITVNGTIKVPSLRMSISGGSDFKGAVEVDDLSISSSGGSDVSISGKTTNLRISASGGSDFKGYDLSSEICYAAGSGGSDMQVKVNKELTVHCSGGSDVHYKGTAVIRESKTSGGGSVSKRD